MLPVQLTGLGTTVDVDTGHEITPAVVVPKPFIDPTKDQPKQDVLSLVSSAAAAPSRIPLAH